ncbi:hypothetical protein [Euzebya tangerina]|uniref:hypothetical protein n=1 Tax=Euzebya tangerina TaxID=591198 RepID=UPI000E31ECEA|nr:hypothetical protein [Euzebya tangerina]
MRLRLLVLLLALGLIATACAGDAAESAGGDDAATQPPEAEAEPDDGQSAADAAEDQAEPATGPEAPAEVPEILDFQATTVAGETISGGDFAGQDLLFWFWAPW